MEVGKVGRNSDICNSVNNKNKKLKKYVLWQVYRYKYVK